MTSTPIASADASKSPSRDGDFISTDRPRFEEARCVEIEHRLAELDAFDRKFRASRRRFKMAAFLKWQALAAARHRRHGKSSERSEDLARSPP